MRALKAGRGHYKSLAFDEDGTQLAFLSDQADYEKPVSPYRVYYWKTTDAEAVELVSAATRGMRAGQRGGGFRTALHGRRRAAAHRHRSAAGCAGRSERAASHADSRGRVEREGSADSADAARSRDAGRRRSRRISTARSSICRTSGSCSSRPRICRPSMSGTTRTARSARLHLAYRQEQSWDQTYNDVYLVDLKTGARRKVMDHMGSGVTMSPGGKYLLYLRRLEPALVRAGHRERRAREPHGAAAGEVLGRDA